MESYKVYLKETHWQEVHVEAENKSDAVKRAMEGEGAYANGTTYEDTFCCASDHRVEEM